MPEMKDGIIYAGKKNEVILVDSLDANKAVLLPTALQHAA
jgi:Fe(3+) dicitrate transport protein